MNLLLKLMVTSLTILVAGGSGCKVYTHKTVSIVPRRSI